MGHGDLGAGMVLQWEGACGGRDLCPSYNKAGAVQKGQGNVQLGKEGLQEDAVSWRRPEVLRERNGQTADKATQGHSAPQGPHQPSLGGPQECVHMVRLPPQSMF